MKKKNGVKYAPLIASRDGNDNYIFLINTCFSSSRYIEVTIQWLHFFKICKSSINRYLKNLSGMEAFQVPFSYKLFVIF